ncbi:NUMOD3 domain-containing DNA-binding protein [Bradyrhizobium sp. HKCCYLS2038]|uniref:NUMOD3 domain-containing DNA-binding protein n=1 Tax=Bradyrhizobium sp. HKCCYLS2038 TaxID=3420764 RepID=UPI003EC07A4C
MPRRSNVLPTTIYWLIDIRPETVASGWPSGYPFYCGKTVNEPRKRLIAHFSSARKFPNKPVSQWLTACGESYVQVKIVEIVPTDGDWRARERFWIQSLRLLYPKTANVADGGSGTPGMVHSDEARAKISAAQKGRKLSAEWCAKISRAHKGRLISSEQRAKISATLKGQEIPVETRTKISQALRGRARSAEHSAKIGAAHKGKIITVEQRAKISATLAGRELSAEHRAKLSAAHKGKSLSAESRAKVSAARKGKPQSAEHRANWKAAMLARRERLRVSSAATE